MTYDHDALEQFKSEFAQAMGAYSLERPKDRRELLYGYMAEFFSDDWRVVREDFQYISARYFDEEIFISYHSHSEEEHMAKIVIFRAGQVWQRYLVPKDL